CWPASGGFTRAISRCSKWTGALRPERVELDTNGRSARAADLDGLQIRRGWRGRLPCRAALLARVARRAGTPAGWRKSRRGKALRAGVPRAGTVREPGATVSLTPEQASAMGKRSGEARRGLTPERIAEELPPLDTPQHIREAYQTVQLWAASGLVPGAAANALAR